MSSMESTNELLAGYYKEHLEEMRSYALKRLGRQDVAEDIVQNVFVRLLPSRMITLVTLPSLVYTVMRNMIYDYWRHRKAVEEYEHLLHSTFSSYSLVDNPESVYSINEIYRNLENGIAQLTSKQEQVYRLHIYEGMKVSEISETLNINYKSVENRLGCARKLVRSYIRKSCEINRFAV